MSFELLNRRSQFDWDGDNRIGELLIALIINGTKTATAGPLSLYTQAELAELRQSLGMPVIAQDDGRFDVFACQHLGRRQIFF